MTNHHAGAPAGAAPHSATSRRRRRLLAGATTSLTAVVAIGAFGMAQGVRAATSDQGAAADANGVQAAVSLVGSNPIVVGPISPSAASEPGGNALSIGNVVSCNDCVPSVLSTGVINTSSAATLSSAANNCLAANGFPVNGLVNFFGGAITGGSACSSTASANVLAAVPGSVLKADVIQTQSVTQSCTAVPVGHAGIVGLSILGQTIPVDQLPVNLGPNTDISTLLPALGPIGSTLQTTLQTLGITIILNEQHYDANGHGLTVNGVHVIISKNIGQIAAGDVVIAHSHSQATCSGQTNTGGLPNPGTSSNVTPVITKTDSTQSVAPGGTLSYTISIAQKTATCSALVSVVDTLPPGFSYAPPPVSGPLGTPVVGTQGGSGRQTVTWRNLQGFTGLADPVVETINVKVSDTIAAGFTYYNEVDATSQDCGSVHGTDAGVHVGVVPNTGGTPTAGTLPNTSAASAPGTGGAATGIVVAGGLLAMAAAGLAIRSRRKTPVSD